MNDTDWVRPTAEVLHFIGLGLSFGVVLLLNLRLLGMMKSVAFADLHRTLPWGMLGFGISVTEIRDRMMGPNGARRQKGGSDENEDRNTSPESHGLQRILPGA